MEYEFVLEEWRTYLRAFFQITNVTLNGRILEKLSWGEEGGYAIKIVILGS